MQPKHFTVVAGETLIYSVGGPWKWLRIESASVSLSIETDQGERVTLEEGEHNFFDKGFSTLYIEHSSSSPVAVQILLSKGGSKGSSKVSGTVDVRKASGMTAAAVIVGTTVGGDLVVAADPDRKRLVVYNNGTATIYLGPSGVTVADGLPVPPGSAWVEDVGAPLAWYGISGTAGQDVRVNEAA